MEGANTKQLASTKTLPHVLNDAVALVDNISSAFRPQADGLRNLLERLQEQRFHLAVRRAIQTGKSTLLNALLGEEVLPVSVIPLTAIPTFIRAGDQRHARVISATAIRVWNVRRPTPKN